MMQLPSVPFTQQVSCCSGLSSDEYPFADPANTDNINVYVSDAHDRNGICKSVVTYANCAY